MHDFISPSVSAFTHFKSCHLANYLLGFKGPYTGSTTTPARHTLPVSQDSLAAHMPKWLSSPSSSSLDPFSFAYPLIHAAIQSGSPGSPVPCTPPSFFKLACLFSPPALFVVTEISAGQGD